MPVFMSVYTDDAVYDIGCRLVCSANALKFSQEPVVNSGFKQGPVLIYLGTCRVVTMVAFLVDLRQQTLSMLLYLIFYQAQGVLPNPVFEFLHLHDWIRASDLIIFC